MLDALQQIQRHVDDHVLLSTDHLAPAQFDQNVDSLQSVLVCRDLRVAQIRP